MKEFKNIKKIININKEKKALLWEKIENDINIYIKNVRINENGSLKLWEENNSLNLISKKKYMLSTIITFLTISLAWGTSFAANSSLPWDLLYNVKVNINENVKSAFTFWAENEAELQLEFINNRIEEKNQLKAEWKLDTDLESKIAIGILNYKKDFEKENEKLKEKNKNYISIELENKLNNTLKANWLNLLNLENTINLNWKVKNNENSIEGNWNIEVEVKNKSKDWFLKIKIDSWIDENINSDIELENNSKIEIDTWINNNWLLKIENWLEADIEIETWLEKNWLLDIENNLKWFSSIKIN